MVSNVVGCAPENVRVDMPVRVIFLAITADDTLAVFEPVRNP